MPLISARNPDVLDFANIDDESDKNSFLRRRSPLTIPNKSSSDPEELSVMTMHSAFQSSALGGQANATNQSSNSFFPGQGIGTYNFFRRADKKQSKESERNHEHHSSDEFSVKSLPIQDSDIESIEQTWNKEQEEVTGKRNKSSERRKFSSQTYSERGVAHSSLHTTNKPTSTLTRTQFGEDCSSAKSIGSASFGDASYTGFTQTASKTHATARRLSPHHESNSSPSTCSERSTVINGRGQATGEKNERKEKSSKKGPPKPKSRRNKTRGGRSSGSSSTKERHDAESISSRTSNTSSNETSASNLEKEMFRLSLELASTLSSLDLSKMEINKYQKQVKDLEDTIKNLLNEKASLTIKLQLHEEKAARKKIRRSKPDISYRSINLAGLNDATVDESEVPVCITPPKYSDDISHSRENSNESRRHDDSEELLFPELNESHLSCSDLYTSQIVSKSTENEEDEFGPNNSINLINPKDEVFDDDPFATFNYSSDKNEEEMNEDDFVGDHLDEERTNTTQNIIARKGSLSVVDSNTNSMMQVSTEARNANVSNQGRFGLGVVTNQFKNRGQIISDRKGNDNDSYTSIKSHQEFSHRMRNNSTMNNRMNISRILRFGKNENNERDELSVSIHSTRSKGSLLELFGINRRD